MEPTGRAALWDSRTPWRPNGWRQHIPVFDLPGHGWALTGHWSSSRLAPDDHAATSPDRTSGSSRLPVWEVAGQGADLVG